MGEPKTQYKLTPCIPPGPVGFTAIERLKLDKLYDTYINLLKENNGPTIATNLLNLIFLWLDVGRDAPPREILDLETTTPFKVQDNVMLCDILSGDNAAVGVLTEKCVIVLNQIYGALSLNCINSILHFLRIIAKNADENIAYKADWLWSMMTNYKDLDVLRSLATCHVKQNRFHYRDTTFEYTSVTCPWIFNHAMLDMLELKSINCSISKIADAVISIMADRYMVGERVRYISRSSADAFAEMTHDEIAKLFDNEEELRCIPFMHVLSLLTLLEFLAISGIGKGTSDAWCFTYELFCKRFRLQRESGEYLVSKFESLNQDGMFTIIQTIRDYGIMM